MQYLQRSYSSYFNRKYGLAGRFWQGRLCWVVLDDTRFLAPMRYFERNAVSARMVKRVEEYEHSSEACHCGLRTDVYLMALPAITEFIRDWPKYPAEEGDQE